MPDYEAHPLPDPDGCADCGQPRRFHCRRWTDAAGWHKWTEPGSAQRLARMKARRGARLAAKAPKPYMPPDPAAVLKVTAVDSASPVFRAIADKLRAFISEEA